MGTFESLEDSFNEKAAQPISTDFDEIQKRKLAMSEKHAEGKETYEDTLRKKNIVSGLAAIFESRLKNATRAKEENSEDQEAAADDTLTFATSTIRYEDQITVPTPEVSEEDIQRFYPHEKYNDVHIEPTNTIKEEPRHDTTNKYGDMLDQFEPRIASEDDINEGRSISSISAPQEPNRNPSEDEVLRHIETHRQNKGERTFSDHENITPTKSEPKETILEEASYLDQLRQPSDLTQPPFKNSKTTEEALQSNREEKSEESRGTDQDNLRTSETTESEDE